ncbi:TPA: DUF1381 domain-containing protein [Staphylococcus aureus]|nr:DUF1381 domain-containing protein [Staphylococcus aureus]HCV3389532.1 DUF1381 domain-containing protein [Staphylococcus aureus]HCY8240497.1 DUF1381 domain-containing protein [Staphylococcus aureus]
MKTVLDACNNYLWKDDNQTFTVVEAESKEEAKEKYEAQVKRDAIIKVSQLFENIRECGE